MCRSLGKFIEPRVVSDMLYCVCSTHESRVATCRVGCTVKTHKDELSVRILHNSKFNIAEGVSAWINSTLKVVLAKYAHICSSSKHLIEIIRIAKPTTRSCLAKVDVKDFYMDGDHCTLVRSCESLLKEHLSDGLALHALGGHGPPVTKTESESQQTP